MKLFQLVIKAALETAGEQVQNVMERVGFAAPPVSQPPEPTMPESAPASPASEKVDVVDAVFSELDLPLAKAAPVAPEPQSAPAEPQPQPEVTSSVSAEQAPDSSTPGAAAQKAPDAFEQTPHTESSALP